MATHPTMRLRPPPPVRVVKHWEVERSGRVWSKRTGDIVVGVPNRRGYLVAERELLHLIVAAAWVPGRTAAKRCVNHVDGNRANNAASNLEWCTPAGVARVAPKRQKPVKKITDWIKPLPDAALHLVPRHVRAAVPPLGPAAGPQEPARDQPPVAARAL